MEIIDYANQQFFNAFDKWGITVSTENSDLVEYSVLEKAGGLSLLSGVPLRCHFREDDPGYAAVELGFARRCGLLRSSIAPSKRTFTTITAPLKFRPGIILYHDQLYNIDYEKKIFLPIAKKEKKYEKIVSLFPENYDQPLLIEQSDDKLKALGTFIARSNEAFDHKFYILDKWQPGKGIALLHQAIMKLYAIPEGYYDFYHLAYNRNVTECKYHVPSPYVEKAISQSSLMIAAGSLKDFDKYALLALKKRVDAYKIASPAIDIAVDFLTNRLDYYLACLKNYDSLEKLLSVWWEVQAFVKIDGEIKGRLDNLSEKLANYVMNLYSDQDETVKEQGRELVALILANHADPGIQFQVKMLNNDGLISDCLAIPSDSKPHVPVDQSQEKLGPMFADFIALEQRQKLFLKVEQIAQRFKEDKGFFTIGMENKFQHISKALDRLKTLVQQSESKSDNVVTLLKTYVDGEESLYDALNIQRYWFFKKPVSSSLQEVLDEVTPSAENITSTP